jgi:triacylglycerol lipase
MVTNGTAESSAFVQPEHSEIARIQRVLNLSVWILAALAIAIGFTFEHSWLIWLGLLVLGSTAIVVAIQCIWMGLSSRGEAAFQLQSFTGFSSQKPLGWGPTLGVWWRETRTCWRVFGSWQPWHWRTEPNGDPAEIVRGKRGVLFIHGYFCNRGLWRAHLQRMHAEGVPCIAVNLEPGFGGIDEYVPIVERAVAALEKLTGEPVVLVCHSMGGLVARAWLRTTSIDRVQRVITIGSPHHGTAIAAAAKTANGQQMRLLSPWIQHLFADEGKSENHAKALYEKFRCVFSDGDNIVFPCATAMLPGAVPVFVPACGHVELVDHPVIHRLIDRGLRIGESTR